MNPIAPYMLAIKLGVVALLLGGLTIWHYSQVRDARKEGYDQAVSERIAADLALTIDRNAENVATAARQRATNTTITEAKNEELAPVISRVNAAPRLRRPAALCDGIALPAKTTSTAGGDSADSSGRLGQPNLGRDPEPQVVREDIDRDFKAYKIALEKDLATGRTCQAFLKANELTP